MRSECHSHSMGTLHAFLLEREKINGYKQLSFLEASPTSKACSHVPNSNHTTKETEMSIFSVAMEGVLTKGRFSLESMI